MESKLLQYIYDLFVEGGMVIAVGAFVAGQIIKQIEVIGNKWIPLCCGLLGGAVALAVPSVFPSAAAAVRAINGVALGWAATGGVETVKQLQKKAE